MAQAAMAGLTTSLLTSGGGSRVTRLTGRRGGGSRCERRWC